MGGGRGEGREFEYSSSSSIPSPLCQVARFVLASRSLATSIRAFNDGIKIQDNRCFEQSSVMPQLFKILLSILRPRNFKTALPLWQRIKCFPFTLHWRNLEKQQSPVFFGFVLEESMRRQITWYRDAIVFEKLRFRDGLSWTVGLTVEVALSNLSGVV